MHTFARAERDRLQPTRGEAGDSTQSAASRATYSSRRERNSSLPPMN
jgi:hypothetical protein